MNHLMGVVISLIMILIFFIVQHIVFLLMIICL
jgi:hypothetical protein